MKKFYSLVVAMILGAFSLHAQITTSTISGVVKDQAGAPVPNATVQAVHVPSGTKYGTVTNVNGAYILPAVRVGGPYNVTVSFVGFKTETVQVLEADLGSTAHADFQLKEESTTLGEVLVTAEGGRVFSKDRTGAAQKFGRNEITSVPIIGARTIDGITKYNPNGDGRSFGGQDSRLNNFTIDGSQFNNGFGLGSSAQAGGRTGASAISLDAIDQLQVNVAPFDIRQSGFVGAGINAVTRSGTNRVEGSVYSNQRDNSSTFTGNSAYDVPVTASKFSEKVTGLRLGLPVIKDKLFFFGNYENLVKTEPGTTWISDGSPLTGSQVSRVKYSDMETLSKFMKEKFDYETGPWEGYNNAVNSEKFLVRMDWNISDKHKLTARYVFHNSDAEINISNSASAGAGNRTTQVNAMSFQNSGYIIQDNTRSAVLELNSRLSDNLHNNLIIGYDKQIEDRAYRSQLFPTIDIRDGAATYTSVGFDPFTPSNKLDYGTFHITNNLTKYMNKHTLTLGLNFEKYRSNNLFYPTSNGVYVFNSLSDFYTAANQSLANNGAPSAFVPARFQLRYSALPGGKEPLQVLEATRLDLYAQDEWNVTERLKISAGIRTAIIGFEDTALENPKITALPFSDGTRNFSQVKQFNTGVLPETQILWEPRLAFNYSTEGKYRTQIRGGTGIFTGRPPYVFVSNQVGNNGVLTGFIDVSGTAAAKYGFTAKPNDYFIPSTPTLPSTFDLAFTDPNYKFPQMWKTNIAVDQKLPFGLIGSVEYLYNRSINAVHYYNANLDKPTTTLKGGDGRDRYANTDAGVRINDNVSMAAVLTNIDGPYYSGLTFKLEKPYQKGFWGSIAWTTSKAYDYMSAGSIASGSWQGARSVNGNNDLGLSFSDNNIPNRYVGLAGYRIEYGDKFGGATTFTLGYVGQQGGAFSYIIAGDANGDRVRDNDLLYVPKDASLVRFAPSEVSSTVNGTTTKVTYTEAQQQEAFAAYLKQDPYLSKLADQHVERNAMVLPILHRFDFSVAQDFYVKVKGYRNTIQIRFDVLNFGNMLNDKWGVSQRATAPSLLEYQSLNTQGEPVYKLARQRLLDGTNILVKDTFSRNSSVFDVWQAQLGLRYIF
ncbi:MAG: TonB-dependent receptor [Bacteroidetes bacterium]|nr:TonB-dependent receptor [Bacteroidota bacterium]